MEKCFNINELMTEIRNYGNEWKFTSIQNLLNEKMPNFLIVHENLNYILMKFILIDKIRFCEIEVSKKFFEEVILGILNKIYSSLTPKLIMKKQAFIQMINNVNIKNRDYLTEVKIQMFIDKFILLISRTISNANENSGEYFSEIENELSGEKIKLFNVCIVARSRSVTQGDKSKKKTSQLSPPKGPRYRKVNIAKKIVRKFKKYLKTRNDIFYSFWESFSKTNFLPPFKYLNFEFKSFSHSYLRWLFSHEGGIELYQDYINETGESELENMYKEYNIVYANQQKDLEKYFKEFSLIFSNRKSFDLDYIQKKIDAIFDVDKINYETKQDELFNGLFNEVCKDEKKKKWFERSRDNIDEHQIDKLIKSESSSEGDVK